MKSSLKRIKKIVSQYDLETIMKGSLDEQDNDINEIILDCMEIEKVKPYTSEWDNLYSDYEKVVYKEIKERLTKEAYERNFKRL